MAEVDDPPLLPGLPPESLHHLRHNLGDGSVRAVQDTGVGVALDDHRPVTNSLDSLSGVMKPVKADDIVPHVARSIERVPRALGKDNHGDGFQSQLLESQRKVLGNVFQVGLRELLESRRRQLASP